MRPVARYYGTFDVLEAAKRLKIDAKGKRLDDVQKEIEHKQGPFGTCDKSDDHHREGWAHDHRYCVNFTPLTRPHVKTEKGDL